jgi:signal recognition particle GTPase
MAIGVELNPSAPPPVVVMVVGPQGGGKTTTVVSSAYLNSNRGAVPISFRPTSPPAATNSRDPGAQAACPCTRRPPVPIRSGVQRSARRQNQACDVVLIDTAAGAHRRS